eukprot:GILI01002260.1.p1 GENE.GILI01002260.1~~GILI01002260.1.p1  ORF type:complete len:133 (+),score=33.67 GILI01002260.1:60-458(+)
MTDRIREQFREQYELKTQELRKLQKELSQCESSKQNYTSQFNENDMVQKEFDILREEDTVYKMIGPVLIKQDLQDAKDNVQKRLDFISKEINRLASLSKELEAKYEAKQAELSKLGQEFQAKMMAAQQKESS